MKPRKNKKRKTKVVGMTLRDSPRKTSLEPEPNSLQHLSSESVFFSVAFCTRTHRWLIDLLIYLGLQG